MAILTTSIPAYGFIDDLPDIQFSEVTIPALLSIVFNGMTLLEDVKMTPTSNGVITIYAKQMIRNMVTLAKPNSCDERLPRLTVRISIPNYGTLTTSGYVIPGGTNMTGTISSDWFAKNFLTWQPQTVQTTRTQPQWLAFIPSKAFEKYAIISTLYTKDGRQFSQTIHNYTAADEYRQFCTDFASLWEAFCAERNLTPLCYDVYGKGYRTGNLDPATAAGTKVVQETIMPNRPFAQRYILRKERFNDICFGFVNTLGGFDTLLLAGKQSYQPEGEISSFKTYTEERELLNEYTSVWEANTGLLESEREARQFQDFLKSTSRYIYQDGIWRRIIVFEHKIKHYRGEPNSYTFKYRLANKNEGWFYDREELAPPAFPDQYFSEITGNF